MRAVVRLQLFFSGGDQFDDSVGTERIARFNRRFASHLLERFVEEVGAFEFSAIPLKRREGREENFGRRRGAQNRRIPVDDDARPAEIVD